MQVINTISTNYKSVVKNINKTDAIDFETTILENHKNSKKDLDISPKQKRGTNNLEKISLPFNSINALKIQQKIKEETIVDYSSYSIKELREIPYDEAKENINKIKERISTLREDGLSDSQSTEAIALEFQLAKIDYSNDTKFNKALYNTMSNNSDSFTAMVVDSEVQVNLQDYYHSKDIQASFVVPSDTHANQELTKEQLNSIDFDHFISTILKNFTEDYNNASSNTKEQYAIILNGYRNISENFK